MKEVSHEQSIRLFCSLAVTPAILAALALGFLGLWQWQEGFSVPWQFRGAINLAAMALVLENVLFAAWIRSSLLGPIRSNEPHTNDYPLPRFAQDEFKNNLSKATPEMSKAPRSRDLALRNEARIPFTTRQDNRDLEGEA
jgi:hypothetical protein